MSAVSKRALAIRTNIRSDLKARFPALFPQPRLPVARVDRSAIVLGQDQRGQPLFLPLRARLEHAQFIGTTGGGKTKAMEHCVRQDIIDGRGVCVVDPHGNHPESMYRSLLQWLDARSYTKNRIIHLIDPNAGTHVTGLDPLALPSPNYDFSVVAEATQEALEKVWGEEDMNAKPTMQRVLAAVLAALTELKLTLAEARLLFDPLDRHGIRAWAIERTNDPETKEELQWLHDIAATPRGAQDFRLEVTGPRNRLAKLTRTPSVRAMVGQQVSGIDFRSALDEGHIILANLAPGPHASDKAMQLLGRLLTRMLFFHCQRRKRPDLPFFFYLDECQLFLSGDVSRLLAESRKYGMGVVLASQYLAQYEQAGDGVLAAVKNATNIKAVFRIKDVEEAAALADLVFTHNLEVPVRSLIKPTVVGHRVSKLRSESVSDQRSVTEAVSESRGVSITESHGYAKSTSETEGDSESQSESEGMSAAEAIAHTATAAESEGMAMAVGFSGNGAVMQSTPDSMTQSASRDRQRSQSVARNSSSSKSNSRSSGHTASRSSTVAETVNESVSVSQSWSTAHSRGETTGSANTTGTGETFEPVYEDRPTAVHGLENMRYLAAQALRNLTAGKAAISFVDTTGMKTAALSVARVESATMPEAAFEALRTRVFEASPSAVPLDVALHALQEREVALIAEASPGVEPELPSAYRTKRARPKKANGNGKHHLLDGVQ